MLTWRAKSTATLGGSFKPILLFGKFMASTVKGIDQGDSVIGGKLKAKIQVFCNKLHEFFCFYFIYF